MILVFGGTTEGRKAVEVLEEAGTTYYYSTLSDGQKIELVHGVHLTGGMEVPEMIACCREQDIRLIVDAAHPFAEELHRNLQFLAKHNWVTNLFIYYGKTTRSRIRYSTAIRP